MKPQIKTLTIIALFNVFSQVSHSRVHDFETTRLKSTAGTGVASILTTEAAVLNPAPLAFFNYSSVYLHKSQVEGIDTPTQSTARVSASGEVNSDSGAMAVIATDSKNKVKGGFAYMKQDEGVDQRKRLSASASVPVRKKSAFGVTYRYSMDRNGTEGEDKYHQTIMGATHVINKEFTLGVVAIDPMRTKPEDSMVIAGGQYLISDILTLMVDVGTDYKDDPSNNLLWRGAAQLRFFQDFYLRAGAFNNKKIGEKGNGVGIAWVSPKLIFDLAMKITKPLRDPTNSIAYGYKVRETGLSLSYRF